LRGHAERKLFQLQLRQQHDLLCAGCTKYGRRVVE
jgi:hypothetical protein